MSDHTTPAAIGADALPTFPDHPELMNWTLVEVAAISHYAQSMYEAGKRSALASAAQPPAGFVLVPVEPTPEMLRAGDQKSWVLPSRDCWSAMLAAAPKAEPPAGFKGLPLRKLEDLQSRGYVVNGLAFEKPVEGAEPERGFITDGGFVGWWRSDHTTPKAEPHSPFANGEHATPAGEYPALPTRSYTDPDGITEQVTPMTFTADQMRSYVDADRAMRAQAAPAAVAPHITQPYTLAEIKAKIASNDYSAELLLQHAMLLLDGASLSANAGEPVAHLWQHCETGRTHIVMPDMIIDADASWQVVGPLYLGATPPTAQAEGWRLVPVEPTEEMKAAAVKYANGSAVYKNVSAEVLRIEEGIYGEVYEAMLAAAPNPPTSAEGVEHG